MKFTPTIDPRRRSVRALLVPVDAVPKLVEYSTLEELQAFVGGYIEGVFGNGWSAYCNEEGKLDGLAVNDVATELACHLGWRGAGQDLLCGPVVFIGGADDEGEDIDVPLWVVHAALKFR